MKLICVDNFELPKVLLSPDCPFNACEVVKLFSQDYFMSKVAIKSTNGDKNKSKKSLTVTNKDLFLEQRLIDVKIENLIIQCIIKV